MKRGTIVSAKYSNAEFKPAKIVESELIKEGSFRYYVSFLEFNRRMDVWLDAADISKKVDQDLV